MRLLSFAIGTCRQPTISNRGATRVPMTVQLLSYNLLLSRFTMVKPRMNCLQSFLNNTIASHMRLSGNTGKGQEAAAVSRGRGRAALHSSRDHQPSQINRPL